MNFAPPDIQLLDKADRDIQAVSHSLSSVLVRKDGEGEEISRKDPDFGAQTNLTVLGPEQDLGGDKRTWFTV